MTTPPTLKDSIMAYVSASYATTEGTPTLRTPIAPPAFNADDEVMVVGGTMHRVIGKVVKSDSQPGTASIYVPAWGSIAHNVPEAHLIRIPA